MNPQKKFHLVFSILMGTIMFLVMTFVITFTNVGGSENFSQLWMKAYGIAFVVGVPMIFFVAPVARKLTGRVLGVTPA
jgi:predicted membrane channel-forming protein YqfA (hemolysin III family)